MLSDLRNVVLAVGFDLLVGDAQLLLGLVHFLATKHEGMTLTRLVITVVAVREGIHLHSQVVLSMLDGFLVLVPIATS